MRIALLSPPWIAVPPPGYGGIEWIVSLLAEELVARGHDVTLFATGDSKTSAELGYVFDKGPASAMHQAMPYAMHVGEAFRHVAAAARTGGPFDVVHDHTSAIALALADRLPVPLVHTVHGPFTEGTREFYARHGTKATLVAISQAQLDNAPTPLRGSPVIPNPLSVEAWRFRVEKDGYLLWLGRMTEEKGPHRAIEVAQRADRPLILAGPVQPGQERFFRDEVEPHLDSDRIRYIGEVQERTKAELLAGASTVLMPIRWAEPFGMVMVEALASGTPVLAFPEGAAREIVLHGENGFLARDEAEMAAFVGRLGEIDPGLCRESVRSRYDPSLIAAAYEDVYVAATSGARAAAVPDLEPMPSAS
jgi:glycosyltransferase involved in cell wall biosynthesis